MAFKLDASVLRSPLKVSCKVTVTVVSGINANDVKHLNRMLPSPYRGLSRQQVPPIIALAVKWEIVIDLSTINKSLFKKTQIF